VWTDFGHEVHIPNNKEMTISPCVQKHFIYVITERLHDGAAAHVSRAVRDILNNAHHGLWIGRGGPIAWPPLSTSDLNPLDLYLWGHLNTLVCATPVDKEEALHHHIVDASQTIRNYPGIFEWFRQSMSMHALSIMEDILSTYYKCILSAITHKLMFFDMFIWTFFLVLIYATRA
jgi:hypothetical protein